MAPSSASGDLDKKIAHGNPWAISVPLKGSVLLLLSRSSRSSRSSFRSSWSLLGGSLALHRSSRSSSFRSRSRSRSFFFLLAAGGHNKGQGQTHSQRDQFFHRQIHLFLRFYHCSTQGMACKLEKELYNLPRKCQRFFYTKNILFTFTYQQVRNNRHSFFLKFSHSEG